MAIVTQAPLATGITVIATNVIFPQASLNNGVATASTSPATLMIPGSGRFEQFPAVVRASGQIVIAAGTPTVTLTLQSGISLTTGSNTTITAPTSAALSATTFPWHAEFRFVVDTGSGKFSGYHTFQVGNLAVTGPTVFTASLTGVNMNTEPALNLVLGFLASTGTTHTASLKQFYLAGD